MSHHDKGEMKSEDNRARETGETGEDAEGHAWSPSGEAGTHHPASDETSMDPNDARHSSPIKPPAQDVPPMEPDD